MRERGIIFNAEMVRAILGGRKTQTRRIMVLQPESPALGLRCITEAKRPADIGKYFWSESNALGNRARSKLFPCPFGQPGDRLWVRETFGFEIRSVGSGPHQQLVYRASRPNAVHFYDCNGKPSPMKWESPISMRRRYSRITLEITGVRAERLNSISEEDAKAEGFRRMDDNFISQWVSIYGSESWRDSPWVWVISFKNVEGVLK